MLLSKPSKTALAASRCVLMFSGGRDSSIAAVRLARAGTVPMLVTITSEHLTGMDSVKRRLAELAQLLPHETRWIRVIQPLTLATDTTFYERTCLSCHHAYVVVAAAVARSVCADRLAFGYTLYQSSWPEQTLLAKTRLTAVLAEYGITLELPVAELESRNIAIAELVALGLSPSSLEQKCSRQVTNVTLDEHRLVLQISLWEQAIRRSIAALDIIPTTIVEDTTLATFSRIGR